MAKFHHHHGEVEVLSDRKAPKGKVIVRTKLSGELALDEESLTDKNPAAKPQ